MPIFESFRKLNRKNEISKAEQLPDKRSADIAENAECMLAETNIDMNDINAVKIPIASLAALGGGIFSLLPSLRRISTVLEYENEGLYRCIFPNGIKGQLAVKDGMNLGTIINEKGIAVQARWQKVAPQTVSTSTAVPFNPAMLMMGAALISIDKKMDSLIETERQVLSFLQEDKEASIEGDLKTLTTIINEYKLVWDDTAYTTTHCQIAADIKRTAEGNMAFYQKQVDDIINTNKALFLQTFVDSKQNELQKRFRYYRLSLYTYAFASFVEVMLQGNFAEDYLDLVRQTIIARAEEYTQKYETCHDLLCSLSSASLDHTVIKGIGIAEKSIGSFIGSIPLVKNGSVDEWLKKNGHALEEIGDRIGTETLKQFETIKDPGCALFTENLENVGMFINHTQDIYIDRDNVYLSACG